MANKSRETANLVSSKTGIAVTLSGDPIILGVGNTAIIRVAGAGKVGIHTEYAHTSVSKVDIYSNVTADNDIIDGSGANLRLIDNRAGTISTNMGGALIFSYRYNSNTFLEAGPYIKAVKTNNIFDDYGGGLSFGVRESGSASQSEVVRITSSSNVGIGTDTPATKLHLTDDSITIEHTTPSVIYRRSSDKSDIVTQQYHVADEAFYTWAKNKDISFSSSLDKGIDYPHLFIKTTTGRVGILTNNPTDNLQIGGADSTVGQTPKVLSLRHGTVPAYLSASYDGTHYITNLSSNIYDSSNGSQSWSSFESSSFAAAAIRLECDTNDSDIRFYTATTDNTTPSERMAIFHNGNIGFGTDAITSGIPYTFVHPTNGSAGGGAILQVATHGNSDLYLSLGAKEIVAGSGSDGMSYIRAGSGGSLNNGLIFEVALSGTETEVARITSDTNPYFRLSSSCAGIQFNGEVSADDTLDHYEEGTWTPELSFSGGTTGITYGTRAGVFTRIGNIVWCRFVMTLSSRGTDTGIPRIGGLPFTVKDALTGTALDGAGEITYHDNRGAETGAQILFPWNSTTYANVYLLFDDGSDSTNATEAAFTNTSSLRGNVWYYV